MKRLTVYSIGIASLLLASVISCSKDNLSRSSASPPGSPGNPTQATDVPEPVKTYDIPFDSVPDLNCPDLGRFFAQLTHLPDDAWLRKITTSINVDKKNSDGSAPRSNFVTMLSFSSFDVREVRSGDFAHEEPAVLQTGCNEVSFTYVDGIHRDYLIQEATADSVKLSLKPDPDALSPESHEMTFKWLNSRLLAITSKYQAMDFCPNYKPITVTRTELLRWGPPDMLQNASSEQMNSIFVEDMTQALYNLPQDLNHLERASDESPDGGDIEVKIADLKRIKMTAVRRDLQICPYRAKPPNGDEPPPPNADEAPAPAPAPDTGVDPTGDADTGPAPAPSPAPAEPAPATP